MTTTTSYQVPSRELWNAMPGWGIAADLTPPELLAGRKLRRIARYVAFGVVAVLGLIVLGYAFAFVKHHAASNELSAVNADQQRLMRQQDKYGNVVRIQGSIMSIRGQIATLMSGDTDVPALLSTLANSTPPGVAVTNLTLTLNAPGVLAASAGTVSLDTTGKRAIGAITLTGAGSKFTDAAAYVDKLRTLPGLIDVFLQSNSATTAGTTFNLAATVTADLLSHRFAKPATSASAGSSAVTGGN